MIILSVLAPKIIVLNSNSNAKLYSNIVLLCSDQSGTTIKPLEFEWIKLGLNGDNIELSSNGDHIRIDHRDEVSTLSIQNVTSYDSGNYSCVAQNRKGSDRFTVSVLVQSNLTFVNFSQFVSVRLLQLVDFIF